ncbi:MAG: hypothetical protein FWE28_10245, partial [Oscillospiraceae bacterium]|nr:hypothetical protein [Oscillospiraceae bacterium]
MQFAAVGAYDTTLPTVEFSTPVAARGTITAAVGETPLTSGGAVNHGTEVMFTAAPAAGFQVASWIVDGTAVTPTPGLTHTLTVNADVTVVVTFEEMGPVLPDNIRLPDDAEYTVEEEDGTLIITIPGDGGDIIITITPDGEMTVELPDGGTVTVPEDSEFKLDEEGDITVTVSVDEDDEIVITVSGDGEMVITLPEEGTVTVPPGSDITVGDEDIAITVPEAGGTVTVPGPDDDEIAVELPGGDVVIAPDGEITITVPEAGGTITTPDNEYTIPGGGVAVIGPDGEVTITAPVEDFTVTFNLAGGTRTGGGALTQQISAGGAAVAPEVTRAGHRFVRWDKGFDNVTADMTVTAVWEAVQQPPVSVPVTGVTGVPDSMVVGEELELTGTVAPA